MVVRVYGGMYNIDMHLFHKREFNEKMDRQSMYIGMYCAVHLFR